jgi:hypothetical protein
MTHATGNVRNQPDQVGAVDRRIPESVAGPVAMRVEAAAADVHDRTGSALRRQGIGTDLPGHCRRMLQRGIERIGRHV